MPLPRFLSTHKQVGTEAKGAIAVTVAVAAAAAANSPLSLFLLLALDP